MSALELGYDFFLALTAVALLAFLIYRGNASLRGHALVLLLLKVPRPQRGGVEHMPSLIARSTELYERLLQFLPQITLEIVVPPVGDEIHFYLAVPRAHQKRTVDEAKRVLPDAVVELSDHYALWMPQAQVKAAYLNQHKPYAMPLKPAVVPTGDPLASVMRALSRLKPLGESVALQWVIRPAPNSLRRQLAELYEHLHSGHATSFRLLHEQFLVSGGTLNLLQEKLASPLFLVNCRIIATAPSEKDAEQILGDLESEFRAISGGAAYNELRMRAGRNPSRSTREFLARTFNPREAMVLSATELAGLSHLSLTGAAAER